MRHLRRSARWPGLLLAVVVLVAACTGRPGASANLPPAAQGTGSQASPATPAALAQLTAAPPEVAASPGSPPTAGPAASQDEWNGGGETTDAVATAAAPGPQASPTLQQPATALPPPALASPTAAPPTAAPPTAVPATPTLAPAPAPATGAATTGSFSTAPNPLQIEVMRQQSYPGSDITFEQTLAPGANYSRYIVSYRSDGYKIFALMTVPSGQKPAAGWPVIVFNHGYIPPSIYRTTERYVAYVDAIARAGYIVFKSDYRGNGSSEGPTTGGAYGSPGYTRDILNAVASLKAYNDADPNRIGMWGHSMGGNLTLRAMVVSKDIKAGVIWGGVVAPYPIMLTKWTHLPGAAPEYIPDNQRHWRAELIAQYGTPDQNPQFWASISPNTYVAGLSGPLQLQASITDEEVPVLFSQTLYDELQAAGKTSQFYTYPGDNHNISANFNVAMQRSIAWFDKYVKGSG